LHRPTFVYLLSFSEILKVFYFSGKEVVFNERTSIFTEDYPVEVIDIFYKSLKFNSRIEVLGSFFVKIIPENIRKQAFVNQLNNCTFAARLTELKSLN